VVLGGGLGTVRPSAMADKAIRPLLPSISELGSAICEQISRGVQRAACAGCVLRTRPLLITELPLTEALSLALTYSRGALLARAIDVKIRTGHFYPSGS
jgi:hypothetical protein